MIILNQRLMIDSLPVDDIVIHACRKKNLRCAAGDFPQIKDACVKQLLPPD
jgi:hypothetical protein